MEIKVQALLPAIHFRYKEKAAKSWRHGKVCGYTSWHVRGIREKIGQEHTNKAHSNNSVPHSTASMCSLAYCMLEPLCVRYAYSYISMVLDWRFYSSAENTWRSECERQRLQLSGLEYFTFLISFPMWTLSWVQLGGQPIQWLGGEGDKVRRLNKMRLKERKSFENIGT